LISKHGILVVEFVNQLQKDRPLKEALIDAAALRLRPILMTTGAMVFGAIPLVMSTGAGHEPQQSLGVILVGGLSVGTLFTLFLLPTVCLWAKGRLKVKID
jgi:multidrug efflux pump